MLLGNCYICRLILIMKIMNEIIKKNGIRYGIYTGIFSVLATIITYAIDLSLFASIKYGLTLLLAYIVIGILLLRTTKKELKGVMTFKEGFTSYFLSIIIGIPISVLFSIILFNYIDIEAQDIIKEITIKNTVEAMENWNVPSAQINETIAEMEKSNPFSTLELLKSTIVYIAVYCFIGLILAAIFKTKSTSRE